MDDGKEDGFSVGRVTSVETEGKDERMIEGVNDGRIDEEGGTEIDGSDDGSHKGENDGCTDRVGCELG